MASNGSSSIHLLRRLSTTFPAHSHHPPQSKQRHSESVGDAHPQQSVAPACIGLVGAIVLVAIVVKLSSPSPKLWTKEELSKYNGSDETIPIFLSILGSMYDVSSGREHYGINRRYNHFAGRDATRAFVTGKSTGDDASDSVQGLSVLQIKSVIDWQSFYSRSYLYSGKLVGRYYDKYGHPTKELQQVEKDAASGAELLKKQEAEESQFPNCNSRWSEKDGGEVWCPTGYPRLVNKFLDSVIKGPVEKRCGCFEKPQLTKLGLELYRGCPPLSKVCKTS